LLIELALSVGMEVGLLLGITALFRLFSLHPVKMMLVNI